MAVNDRQSKHISISKIVETSQLRLSSFARFLKGQFLKKNDEIVRCPLRGQL